MQCYPQKPQNVAHRSIYECTHCFHTLPVNYLNISYLNTEYLQQTFKVMKTFYLVDNSITAIIFINNKKLLLQFPLYWHVCFKEASASTEHTSTSCFPA